MVPCAYCEQPLICEGCGEPYLPPSQDAYQALSAPDAAVICPVCEAVLICRWCKTPYDGLEDAPSAPEGA